MEGESASIQVEKIVVSPDVMFAVVSFVDEESGEAGFELPSAKPGDLPFHVTLGVRKKEGLSSSGKGEANGKANGEAGSKEEKEAGDSDAAKNSEDDSPPGPDDSDKEKQDTTHDDKAVADDKEKSSSEKNLPEGAVAPKKSLEVLRKIVELGEEELAEEDIACVALKKKKKYSGVIKLRMTDEED